MKKAFSVLLTLVLLCCSLSTALAESWFCPNCSTLCSGNFCSNCGTKKPTKTSSSSSSITGIQAKQLDNGDTFISWNAGSTTGPYKVTYTMKDWENYWRDENQYVSTMTQLRYLNPGATYTLTVTDIKTGASGSIDYTVPAPIFREFKTGGKYLELTEPSFSLRTVKANPLSTFELRTSWPRLSHPRSYQAKVVLLTPTGGFCPRVYVISDFTLENKYSYRYSTYSLYQDWLKDIEEEYGYIPLGTYTFQLYLDGDLYDYASFSLNP